MFDDPKLTLHKLEQALKEAEMEAPVLEEEAGADDDLDQWLREAKELLGDAEPEAPIRNQANNYGRRPEAADIPRLRYAHEEMKESDALYVEKPKRKGAGSLVFLALLEIIAMGLVGLWWLRWTL